MSGTGEHILNQPLDGLTVLRRKRALKRELLAQEVTRRPLRIAILAGSTSGEVRDILELFLLHHGIEPSFYEFDYDRVFEEALFDHERLDAFKPELIYVHTTIRNLKDPSAETAFERFFRLAPAKGTGAIAAPARRCRSRQRSPHGGCRSA